MISSIPSFCLGVSYIDYPGDDGNWRFQFRRRLPIVIDVPVAHRISFRDGGGTEWAQLRPGLPGQSILEIAELYSWDGCSPKWRCGRFYFGTPDFEGTRLGSGVHDWGYQFSQTEHFPFSKEQVDDMFFDCMKLSGFKLKGIYHGAVAMFAQRAWDRADPNCHSVLLPLRPDLDPV
jgi:hypothetical protein